MTVDEVAIQGEIHLVITLVGESVSFTLTRSKKGCSGPEFLKAFRSGLTVEIPFVSRVCPAYP